MPASTPLMLYQYPLTTDQAAPSGIQTLAQAIEKQVVAVFPDAGTRDSRWAAATGLANGAMCFLISTGELQLRSGGAWVVIGGRANAFAMATGSVAYTRTAVTNVSVSLTFPAGRFSIAPMAIANSNSAGAGTLKNVVRTFAVTTTGMSINISTGDNTATTDSGETVGWYAIQMSASAAGG